MRTIREMAKNVKDGLIFMSKLFIYCCAIVGGFLSILVAIIVVDHAGLDTTAMFSVLQMFSVMFRALIYSWLIYAVYELFNQISLYQNAKRKKQRKKRRKAS